MVRIRYTPEDFGTEVQAPSGYYLPAREEYVEFKGGTLLLVLGSACIEASCCGVGSWKYVRVEGYVVRSEEPSEVGEGPHIEIETIESAADRDEIVKMLTARHPGARVEFR
jgi:hypothetical protein